MCDNIMYIMQFRGLLSKNMCEITFVLTCEKLFLSSFLCFENDWINRKLNKVSVFNTTMTYTISQKTTTTFVIYRLVDKNQFYFYGFILHENLMSVGISWINFKIASKKYNFQYKTVWKTVKNSLKLPFEII